jgi:hypothetical protein
VKPLRARSASLSVPVGQASTVQAIVCSSSSGTQMWPGTLAVFDGGKKTWIGSMNWVMRQ